MQPHPGAPALHVDVLDPHADCRAHARERVDHQSDQRAIAQAHGSSDVDRIEHRPRLLGGQDGGFSLAYGVPRSAHGARRVEGHDLADHEPVEEDA